jgi:quinol monooxygenase YgiN
MGYVMAVYDFHGDSAELAAEYDNVLRKVVAVSSSRPVIHLALPREYGFMVIDVWTSEEALSSFQKNEDFQRVLRESRLPEPKLRTYPIHNVGWPVDEMPMYR